MTVLVMLADPKSPLDVKSSVPHLTDPSLAASVGPVLLVADAVLSPVLLARVKPVTLQPRMPKLWKSFKCSQLSCTFDVLFRKTPMPEVVLLSAPGLCWMIPPELVLPLPVTVKPPAVPVVSRLIPTPAEPEL